MECRVSGVRGARAVGETGFGVSWSELGGSNRKARGRVANRLPAVMGVKVGGGRSQRWTQ